MTCFWDGILNSLNNDEKNKLGLENKNSIYCLIDCLKNLNNKTQNVLWQNRNLSCNELKENYEHIRLYNKTSAKNGYLCSTCDPFLILLCEILEKDLSHYYLGNNISYKNTKKNMGKINYQSNRGHFWFKNRN
tara:strand:+ start:1061 stop:1459 length:399 start_codon:yes stop_codon:yes gene_type:complete